MSYRLFLLMRKEFVQFFRNIPLIFIVLYLITFDVYSAGSISMDINNYPIAIYNLDQTQDSVDIIDKLREPYFKITHVIEEENQVQQLIESGEVSVVVVFPQDFSKKLNSYQTAEMQVILDGSISNASQLAMGYIARILQDYNEQLILTAWKISDITKKMIPYVNFEKRYVYNPNLIDSWNFSLQELFLIITLIGMLLIAAAMVNEKQFGTIEQLMVTPLRIYEIMLAKIVPMVIILLMGTFIAVFVTLKYWVGMPITTNVWAFFVVTLLYVFTVAGLGLMISTISSNLSDTVLFSILILVPMLFLSGAYVPLEAMPEWMRWIVRVMPLKYYIDLGSGILLKENSLFSMWREMGMLLLLGIAAFTIGAIRFRKAYQ